MKCKHAFVFVVLIILVACETVKPIPGVKPMSAPGLSTMKKYGKKLNPYEILHLSGQIMGEMGIFGAVAYNEYINKLNMPNNKRVFIVESIVFNKEGFAQDIKGRIEKPATYMEFVAKGGLGIPVYEANTPNELGVIFGRRANIASRDGVIVRVNPLEYTDLYYIHLGSETYDAIMNASILFQSYEMVRTPYIDNLRVELEGMIMNSDSRELILGEMKKFKEENKDKYDSENDILVAFINSNESYLEMLGASNQVAIERIHESKIFLDMIKNAAETASGRVALIFGEIALDIALITLETAGNAMSRGDSSIGGMLLAAIEATSLTIQKTAEYVARNIPRNSSITLPDLQNINAYNNYMFNRYIENSKKNSKAEMEANAIFKTLKKTGAIQ